MVEQSIVLDGFAGTGALGLEALSRGAARACFIESDATALAALRSNITACNVGRQAQVLASDVLRVGPGEAATLIFLDPPYGQCLVPRALAHLKEKGRIERDAVIVAELGQGETWAPDHDVMAEREHGAARILVFRAAR